MLTNNFAFKSDATIIDQGCRKQIESGEAFQGLMLVVDL